LRSGWGSEGEEGSDPRPERGEKKNLALMACENAEKFLVTESELEKDEGTSRPRQGEAPSYKSPAEDRGFDISNIQGVYAVGSMVAFEDGIPAKEGYRHFKIKSIEGADDYGMMYEVLFRRYKRALERKPCPTWSGGRGQGQLKVPRRPSRTSESQISISSASRRSGRFRGKNF